MNNIDTFQLGYDVSPMEIAFVAGKKMKIISKQNKHNHKKSYRKKIIELYKIYIDQAYSLIGDPPITFKNFLSLIKASKLFHK